MKGFRKIRNAFFGILYSALFLFGCTNKNKSVPSIDVIKVDTLDIKNDTFLENYLEQSDGRDRTIWQKPYEIIQLLGPLEDKVVADIGAGSGYFSFRFVHRAKKVIAIDIERQLIDMMNAEKTYYKEDIQKRFEARLATPDNPKLLVDEVDIVFISNTYTYINNRVEYLKNLKKSFRKNGRIMIVDFKKKLTPIGPDQKNRLAQSDVEEELIRAGYTIQLSNDTTLQYQYIIIAMP
ncbi:MAG: class I SAM-dependent methyltransferase [Bacteroidota bacterium]|nr:class I SAM-dependent methyltransferase [Bacteroidota bacterium]